MSRSIMIVDDEEEIREVFEDMLKDEFDSIFLAGSGVEALEILGKNKIMHVIADLVMPEMSGLELVKRIKEEHPWVFITISTGVTISQEDMDSLIAYGVLGFLFKPTTKEQIINQLRSIESMFGSSR